MSDIPDYDSKEYKKLRDEGRLIFELGQVILEEYGEKKAKELLRNYKLDNDKK